MLLYQRVAAGGVSMPVSMPMILKSSCGGTIIRTKRRGVVGNGRRRMPTCVTGSLSRFIHDQQQHPQQQRDQGGGHGDAHVYSADKETNLRRRPQEGDRLAMMMMKARGLVVALAVSSAVVMGCPVEHVADAATAAPVAQKEPFLKRTGAKGLLAEEEEQLYRLRQLEEGRIREELEEAREELEEEAKRSYDGKLCATPFGVDVVGITEFVALTGALVGGISARRRKQELERLNEQLRTINTQLRQQARAGTLYAPGLTYAPTVGAGKKVQKGPSATTVSMPTGASAAVASPQAPQKSAAASPQKPLVQDDAAPSKKQSVNASSTEAAAAAVTVSLASIDEEDMRPEVKQCQAALKEGKRLLKEKDAAPAMVRFEKALMLAKALGDQVRERRAVRGLAASNRLLGRYSQAIEYLERVLQISDDSGDHVGDADAYGTIADIYTEMGEFEKAAEFYDKYIGKMTVEGPV